MKSLIFRPSPARRAARCLLAFTVLTGPLSTPQAHADIQQPKAGPSSPQAKDVEVSVTRGESVEITLAATTSSIKTPQFTIRKAPQAGRLAAEGVKRVPGEPAGTILYTADPDSAAAVDTFTWVMKMDGVPPSSEGKVTIRIIDTRPDLELSPGVDAGLVVIGRPMPTGITVINRGNGPYRKKVPLPAGWQWETPAGGVFDIAPGASLAARVSLRLQKPGEFSETIRFDNDREVKIIGRAEPPFLAYPSVVKLVWDPATRTRRARLDVQNALPEQSALSISGTTGLKVPETLSVALLDTAGVDLVLDSRHDKKLTGTVTVSGPDYSQAVPWEAPPAPAIVEFTGLPADGRVDFGKLDATNLQSAGTDVTVHNAGGETATLNGILPAAFAVTGFTGDHRLNPGESLAIRLAPRTDLAGPHEEEFKIRYDGGTRTITLVSEVDPEALQKTLEGNPTLLPGNAPLDGGEPEPTVKSMTQVQASVVMNAQRNGIFEPKGKIDGTLPQVDVRKLTLVKEEPDSLLIEFPPPGPGQWTYQLLYAIVVPQKGLPPVKQWVPWPKTEFRPAGSATRAEINGLAPGIMFKTRLLAINSDGVSGNPGPELSFITPDRVSRPWGWYLLWTALTISAIVWIRQKFREDVKWKA